MSDKRRWYDKDPILQEALEVLKIQSDEKKETAAQYLIKLQEDVAADVIERVYDMVSQYQETGNRWYDKDPVMLKAVELLRQAPPHIQRVAALKLLLSLEQNNIEESKQ